jgi:hypothetical protein
VLCPAEPGGFLGGQLAAAAIALNTRVTSAPSSAAPDLPAAHRPEHEAFRADRGAQMSGAVGRDEPDHPRAFLISLAAPDPRRGRAVGAEPDIVHLQRTNSLRRTSVDVVVPGAHGRQTRRNGSRRRSAG